MRKLGACFLIAGLTAVLVASPPVTAFGFQLGPFRLGLPSFWHRHYRHPSTRANPNDVARREQSQESTSDHLTFALLYPGRALPAIFQNIFWPANSTPWPFGYEKIFTTAFAPLPTDRNSDQCRQFVDTNAIVERIRKEIEPTSDQMERLQKLGGALGAASGYLANSCPGETPSQPTARLQLMESKIEKLTLAIDIAHAPLQDLEKSLSSEQLGRFAGTATVAATSDQHSGAESAIRSCGASLAVVGWSVDQIVNSIRPNEQQRVALDDVQQVFEKAERDLEAHCPTSVPQSVAARLETIESRLDATWRAILSIQVALANFETKLSDEQKQRFDAINFAAQ
jgi:LTXXQ motif family protein